MARNIVNFPTRLNHLRPTTSGFNYTKGQNKIETRFASGKTLIKKVPRFIPDVFEINLIMSYEEFLFFETWFEDDLDNGFNMLSWINFVNDRRTTYTVLGSYAATPQDSNNWSVALTLEVAN